MGVNKRCRPKQEKVTAPPGRHLLATGTLPGVPDVPLPAHSQPAKRRSGSRSVSRAVANASISTSVIGSGLITSK